MLRNTACFIIGSLFMAASGAAQDQRAIDSLQRVLTAANEVDRLNPLIDLALEFVDNDNDRALILIEQAHATALRSGDSLNIAKCRRLKGQILGRLQRFDDALHSLGMALSITERNGFDEERLNVLMPYANLFAYQSQYDRALQMYSVAHELAIANADTVNIQFVLNNLGVIYYKLKDYSKALQIWQSVLALQPPKSLRASQTLMNISLAYANLGDYKNARETLHESVAACGDDCIEAQLVHIHYASGVIFLGLKDADSAERELLRSYELSKRINDNRMLLDNIDLLADVYEQSHRTDLALVYLKEAEAIIDRGVMFNLEITKIYQRLSEVYLDQDNFRKAAEYQAKYIALKDSIYSEELTTRLMKAEADHLERFNQAQIASQKGMIILKEEVIERQRILNVLMVLLALVILGGCAVLYRNYRLKQLMNLSLEERIRDRTHELERSRGELLAALKERDVLLGRAEKEILETMSTIKGLCHTGKEEANRFATYSYLEKIEKVSGRLSGHLFFLLPASRWDDSNG